MIITFICDVLGGENNGTTIATMNVIRAMKAKGHEVRIVCYDEDKKGQEGYFIVPKINFGPFNNYVKKNGVAPASKKDEATIRKALEGADICHFNFCGFLSSRAVDIAHEMGIPCTASLHTQAENYTNHVGLMNSHWANDSWYHLLYKALFSKVEAIHYPSQFIRDLFEEKNHFKSNGYVISNGIQKDFHPLACEKPAALKDKKVLVFTARYSKEKDHKILFKALHYSRYEKDIQLILPGAGPDEERFKKWGAKLSNPPILGFHSREEMVQILNYADLYVHPSLIDIEPLSALEAMACGLTPVLSDSKRSSVRYFALDKRNLFHHNKKKDLAAAIDYWLSHPEEKQANRESYLAYVQQFDFQTSMNRMEAMYLKTSAEWKAKKATPAAKD
jgi:1,2-diacylglycerol 3-alpha-glucosyltransferase